MWYLGVPIIVGGAMVVVRDDDFLDAIERLESAGFHPEIMEDHPNPEQMLEEINAGYKRVDKSCVTLDYPYGAPSERGLQLYIFPDSFAHLFDRNCSQSSTYVIDAVPAQRFHSYNNLNYPLEQALVESFVKAAIDEENETGFSVWGESLRSWISLMIGYLDVDNDILDHCPNKQVVEWYSKNFGRIQEANFGPIDRRVSKRLGSGKDMPVDMRGASINDGFASSTKV